MLAQGDHVERGSALGRGRQRGLAGGFSSILLVLAVVACTAKTSPSPVASPVGSSSPSTAGVVDTSTTASNDFPSAGDAATSDAPTASPSPSPTPPLPTGPLPSVSPAPTGAWTGLTWIAVPGGHSPAVASKTADGDISATIEGWSKGYFDFVWSSSKRTLTPWASIDGLNWHVATKLDTSSWNADFKSYDKSAGRGYHDSCWFEANAFQQGPAALLLKGIVYCTPGCTQYWSTKEIAWTSADGASWQPVADPPGWAVAGGSVGFISYDASKPMGSLWTSPDGRAWTKGALPSLPAASWVNSPVALAGGYVLPGVIMVKQGHQEDGPEQGDGLPRVGCAGVEDADKSLYQEALWWSPDGQTWTRDALSGTTSGYPQVYGEIDMDVYRVDDHTVIAAGYLKGTETDWVSRDGRVWTRLKISGGGVVAGRDRGLTFYYSGSASHLTRNFAYFDNNLKLVTLNQTGSAPWIDDWQTALGPTGLLVTEDGSRFWLGTLTGSPATVPTATPTSMPTPVPSASFSASASALDSTTP